MGYEMINHGYDYHWCSRKFRCPYVMGMVASCPLKDQFSPSDCERFVYINDSDDAHNSGPLYIGHNSGKKSTKAGPLQNE